MADFLGGPGTAIFAIVIVIAVLAAAWFLRKLP
jgi:hypothetical protein